jgi:hypothetical protein
LHLYSPGSIPNWHSNCSFPIFNYCPSSQWRCAPYKPSGSTFNLIRRHVSLNGVVSCINRTLWGQFLREIWPLKKVTTKYNAASGIIAGELLSTDLVPSWLFPQSCTILEDVQTLEMTSSLQFHCAHVRDPRSDQEVLTDWMWYKESHGCRSTNPLSLFLC